MRPKDVVRIQRAELGNEDELTLTSLSLLADTYLEAVAATGSRRSRYPNSTSEGEDIRPRSFDYYRYLRHLVFHSLAPWN